MVSNIFILDKHLVTKKALTINGQHTFFNDLYKQDLSTGTESYEFSTNYDNIDEQDYIMFRYHKQYKLFQITEIEQSHYEGKIITTVYGESVCLELLNGAVRATTLENCNIKTFLEYVLGDTDWSYKYSATLKDKYITVKIDKTTQIWTVIQDYMSEFGYEINTRVKYEDGRATAKIIEFYAEEELGNKTYKRFEYSRNVKGIVKKKDIYDFCTALIIESNHEVIGTGLSYNADGYTKKDDSDVVFATKENKTYNSGRDYIYGVYEDNDSDSAGEVIENAVAELKRRATPKFDYEVDTALTYEEYEDVSIGDTVYVIDHSFNPILTLEARIGALELSFTDRNDCKCNLTNYKEVKSGINPTLTGNVQTIIETYFPIDGSKISNGAISKDKLGDGLYDNIVADSVEASEGVFENLIAKHAIIETLQAKDVEIEGKLTAAEATIGTLSADVAEIGELKADVANIKEANIELLKADEAIIDRLEANEATIGKLDAEYAQIDFANIDFANIGKATFGEFYANSAIIGDLTVNNETITGKLVGVTIQGDLIEGNTIAAEKLLIKGEDGLYYRLNVDALGETTASADPKYQSGLDGSVIIAQSVTASKINVSDLVAFDATIGGFKIDDNSIYSGVKESVDNSTTGIYFGSDGQMAIGDGNNYIKYYENSEGNHVLDLAFNKGITSINEWGVKISHSDFAGHTHIASSGFYVNNGTEDVVMCNTDGLTVKGTITGSNIIGSTFSSANDTFQVYDDGAVSTNDISISNEVSAFTVSAERLNVSWYDRCLTRNVKVTINESHMYPAVGELEGGEVELDESYFYHGATFRSVEDLMQVAPRNLNGYTLNIHLGSSLTSNTVFNGFNNGTVKIHMNNHNIKGYLALIGRAEYYVYGYDSSHTNQNTQRGRIKPNNGYNYGDNYFAVYCSANKVNLYDLDIYKGNNTANTQRGIAFAHGCISYISNIKAVNKPDNLVRAQATSHVYVASSRGTTSGNAFQATSGAIVQLNNGSDIKQANKDGYTKASDNVYMSGNGKVFYDGVTWDNTAQTGDNDNTNTVTTVTKTITIKSDYGDSYRTSGSYSGTWKKDNTVRAGRWATSYGSNTGCWFFGDDIYNILRDSKNEITSVKIKITRQSGGYNSAVNHYLRIHKHEKRPGSPSLISSDTFSKSFTLAVGSSITLSLSKSEIDAMISNEAKGFGLYTSSTAQTNYTVCSGSATVTIKYKTTEDD